MTMGDVTGQVVIERCRAHPVLRQLVNNRENRGVSDSFAIVELLVAVEDEFGIVIDDNAIESCLDSDDVLRLLRTALEIGHPGATG